MKVVEKKKEITKVNILKSIYSNKETIKLLYLLNKRYLKKYYEFLKIQKLYNKFETLIDYLNFDNDKIILEILKIDKGKDLLEEKEKREIEEIKNELLLIEDNLENNFEKEINLEKKEKKETEEKKQVKRQETFQNNEEKDKNFFNELLEKYKDNIEMKNYFKSLLNN